MARSNRKSHSKGGVTRRTTTLSQAGPQEIKLTKEQLEEDARDQKKFYMILGGITVLVLIIIYIMYFRSF